MRELNSPEGRDPDYLLVAKGYDLSASRQLLLNSQGTETMPLQNGGIVDTTLRTLDGGTRLYRFGDRRRPVDGQLNGEWWVRRKELDQIIRYAEVNAAPLGFAVRRLLIVPIEWGSNLDMLIGVRTRGPLLVFTGLGGNANASDKLTRTQLTARNDIAAWRTPQVFVPGLQSPRRLGRDGKRLSLNRATMYFGDVATHEVHSHFTWIHH